MKIEDLKSDNIYVATINGEEWTFIFGLLEGTKVIAIKCGTMHDGFLSRGGCGYFPFFHAKDFSSIRTATQEESDWLVGAEKISLINYDQTRTN